MLDTTTTNGTPSAIPKVIHGQSAIRRKWTATDKAFFVAEVCAGRVIFQPARSQLCRLINVSVPMAAAAERLSPLERAAVRSGIVALSKHLPSRRAIRSIDTAIKRGTDAELEALLVPYAERILRVLDRITAPHSVAAE
jgi:hypothetical protein